MRTRKILWSPALALTLALGGCLEEAEDPELVDTRVEELQAADEPIVESDEPLLGTEPDEDGLFEVEGLVREEEVDSLSQE